MISLFFYYEIVGIFCTQTAVCQTIIISNLTQEPSHYECYVEGPEKAKKWLKGRKGYKLKHWYCGKERVYL